MKTRGWVVLAASMLFVVFAAVLGFRMWTVHEQTWDWALWPREVPKKAQFAGRDLYCGDNPEPVAPGEEHFVAGMSVQGKTAGGGEILSHTPEVGIYIGIKATDGIYGCTLMGGL